jgi:hypothetical protein
MNAQQKEYDLLITGGRVIDPERSSTRSAMSVSRATRSPQPPNTRSRERIPSKPRGPDGSFETRSALPVAFVPLISD